MVSRSERVRRSRTWSKCVFFEVFFLGCVNRRKGIPMMNPCCFEWERGQRKGPRTVESEKVDLANFDVSVFLIV